MTAADEGGRLEGPRCIGLDAYDAGLLSDYGGGNVDWWWDYIRSLLGSAHDFYDHQAASMGEERDRLREALAFWLQQKERFDQSYGDHAAAYYCFVKQDAAWAKTRAALTPQTEAQSHQEGK